MAARRLRRAPPPIRAYRSRFLDRGHGRSRACRDALVVAAVPADCGQGLSYLRRRGRRRDEACQRHWRTGVCVLWRGWRRCCRVRPSRRIARRAGGRGDRRAGSDGGGEGACRRGSAAACRQRGARVRPADRALGPGAAVPQILAGIAGCRIQRSRGLQWVALRRHGVWGAAMAAIPASTCDHGPAGAFGLGPVDADADTGCRNLSADSKKAAALSITSRHA